MAHLIAPSILTADFGNLSKVIELINNSEADWFHLDVMDGVFVPNISFGLPVISSIKKLAKKPLDVHLMIVNPEKYIEQFKEAGADILTVHYEACTHLHSTLQKIKAAGMQAGVSLNPHTPAHILEEIISEADLVLIMSVNPGFGGQKFIEQSYEKIRKVKEMTKHTGTKTLIEVDGGVGPGNAKKLIEAGADVLVAGNSVLSSEDPVKTIKKLKELS